jgi:hypothetical protein
VLDEDISESKLKELNADAEEAKGKLDAKSRDCAALRAEIDTLSKWFIEDAAQRLSGCALETAGCLLGEAVKQALLSAKNYQMRKMLMKWH